MQTDIFGSAKQLQIRVEGAIVTVFWYYFETFKHIRIKDNPEILVYVTFKVAPQYFNLTIRVLSFKVAPQYFTLTVRVHVFYFGF